MKFATKMRQDMIRKAASLALCGAMAFSVAPVVHAGALEDDFSWSPGLFYPAWANGEEVFGQDVRPNPGAGSVVVPEEVEGIPVVSVSGFGGSGAPTQVTLPNTIVEIVQSAFAGSPVNEITLPQSLKRMGSNAFYKAPNLRSITIPSGVAEIGKGAFSGCESLETANVQCALEAIPESMFDGCRSLRSVQLAEGIRSIGRDAFSRCHSLVQINLPGSLVNIGPDAFVACRSLSELNYGGTMAQWREVRGSEAFGAGYTIHCTDGDIVDGQEPGTNEPEPIVTPEPVVTPEPTCEPAATPEPTMAPVVTPEPTIEPTLEPEPTAEPTSAPVIDDPAADPDETVDPMPTQEAVPSSEPTAEEPEPSNEPAPFGTAEATPTPDAMDVPEPTVEPTLAPSPSPSQTVAPSQTAKPAAGKMQPKTGSAVTIDLVDGEYLVRGIRVSQKATVGDMIAQIKAPVGTQLMVTDRNGRNAGLNTLIATGMQFTLTDASGRDLQTATAVIMGDPMGTGNPSITQVTCFAQALTGDKPIEGVYLMAADWNGNGILDMGDLVAQTKVLLEKAPDLPIPVETETPAPAVTPDKPSVEPTSTPVIDEPVESAEPTLAPEPTQIVNPAPSVEPEVPAPTVVPEETQKPAEPAPTQAPVANAAKSVNMGAGNYTITAPVKNSNLVSNALGGLTRVELIGKQIVVEDYATDWNLVGTRTLPVELERFGGFYEAEDCYFLMFADTNMAEDNNKEVARVVKYSKDWNRVSAASIRGANTSSSIFDAGVDCAEFNGYLYIHGSHVMYARPDGSRHQQNITMVIRKSDMKVMYVREGTGGAGKVSHSFDQYIHVDDNGMVVTLDLGDATPRALAVQRYEIPVDPDDPRTQYPDWIWGKPEREYVREFAGQSGDNWTGTSVGGFAPTQNGYVTAYNWSADPHSTKRDVYLALIDGEDLGNIKNIQVTFDHDARTPQLVPTSETGGYIFWETGVGQTVTHQHVQYATYDIYGNVSEPRNLDAHLSDCQPVVHNDQIVWYVTGDDSDPYGGTMTTPTFYILDETGLHTKNV